MLEYNLYYYAAHSILPCLILHSSFQCAEYDEDAVEWLDVVEITNIQLVVARFGRSRRVGEG